MAETIFPTQEINQIEKGLVLTMNNIPVVKLGIVAVSRDCFPIVLSEKRRAAIKAAYKGDLY